MFNLELMIIAVLVVGFIIYKQIDKITQKLDKEEANPDMSRYVKFCDKIDNEIDKLNTDIKFSNIVLKDNEKKDDFIEKLSLLRKELVFIQNMHSSNKNALTWEKKIFSFLTKFEDIVNEYLQDNEKINDEIRERLEKEFNSLN
ncbi:hypothetical protein CBLAS_0736 [Campylobacter blaseri]|uniref:Thioester dehydrase family protein n=1 Tax=Campylobacter blaseri TaxID=2042961 RepID=A0A2P8R297_9BACT|nr:hypothetical protein [Campylobacter blaseri]PSM52626.1 hypothetical protein CQ405_02535 [Campylobacter blaseri]PSM54274.1 hypothetical protein CRN67_02535 [Campylobacter blaseri]QKF85925.1 hypothetical protein CBLAS_0736 [Campylobacter blaseri]